MQNTNDDNLSGKIKDWLEKQGQSLEMRVAKLFRENGFVVSQFEYFIDPETQAIRQTDVVASISQNIGNCLVNINLVVECKYAKPKPWVILVTQQKFDRFTFFGRVLNGKHPSDWKNLQTLQGRLAGKIALSLDRSEGIERFEINPAGYTIKEARIDSNYKEDPHQKDYAYEAIMQVSESIRYHDEKNEKIFRNIIKSYEDELSDDIEFGRTKHASPLSLVLGISFPLVVINGRLFESHLSEDNSIDVSEIKSGFVLVPYKQKETNSLTVPLSAIMVVTENSLNSFILTLREMIESILKQDKVFHDLIDFEESKINPSKDLDF